MSSAGVGLQQQIRQLLSQLRGHPFGILICAITVYGFILRAYHFEKQSFWMDEGISVVHAQAILNHGIPQLENNRSSWDSFPVHYLMSIALCLFNDPQYGARLWSVLLGTACIPLFYLLNRRLFGSPWQALIAASLMTVLTCEIAWSRQARMYIYLQFFTLFSLLMLYRHLDSRGRISMLLSAIFALLAVFTHRAGYLVILIGGLTFLLSRRPDQLRATRIIGSIFGTFAIIAAGVILVPGHSNVFDAMNKLLSFGGLNYAIPYAQYLAEQLGILLVLVVIGVLPATYQSWRKCSPLLIGTLAYCMVFAFVWRYYAHRYAFPVVIILLIFAAYAISLPITVKATLSRTMRILRGITCLILFLATLALSDTTMLPHRHFLLGYTEPQPDWKHGYEMIARRDAMIPETFGQSSKRPVTISAFPYFHDIYFGQNTGTKYYLPISYTGFPGDTERTSSYTSATPVYTLESMLRLRGYVILDDFSLLMLASPDIQNYLRNLTPNVVIKGDFNLFIWVLPGSI